MSAKKPKRDDLSVLLEEMLASTGGPITEAERQVADWILRGSKRKQRRVARGSTRPERRG